MKLDVIKEIISEKDKPEFKQFLIYTVDGKVHIWGEYKHSIVLCDETMRLIEKKHGNIIKDYIWYENIVNIKVVYK